MKNISQIIYIGKSGLKCKVISQVYLIINTTSHILEFIHTTWVSHSMVTFRVVTLLRMASFQDSRIRYCLAQKKHGVTCFIDYSNLRDHSDSNGWKSRFFLSWAHWGVTRSHSKNVQLKKKRTTLKITFENCNLATANFWKYRKNVGCRFWVSQVPQIFAYLFSPYNCNFLGY